MFCIALSLQLEPVLVSKQYTSDIKCIFSHCLGVSIEMEARVLGERKDEREDEGGDNPFMCLFINVCF